jgi:hypothetical protein
MRTSQRDAVLDTAERLFYNEGFRALVPVLDSDRVIRHVHALLAHLRHTQTAVAA